MLMCDGDDGDGVTLCFASVDHHVGEVCDQSASDSRYDFAVRKWESSDAEDGGFNGFDEAQSKSVMLAFVPRPGFFQFLASRRTDNDLHGLYLAKTCAIE